MSYIGNIPTTAAFVTDSFSANGSGTVFTLSTAPANTSSILVAVSGVLQDPSTYSVAATTLTFSAAPPAGTGNISVRFLGIPASGVTTTAYRTVTECTATAGQTTFTPPSYTAGYISVYRNGVLLGSADYTATNGTTVVLATGATAGDLITTESFYVSSVLNAIPAVANAVTDTYLNTNAVTTVKITDANVTQAKLASGVAGNGPAFSAWKSSNQSISSGVFTKVTFDNEIFDTNSNFSSSTFTPTVAGYYQINATIDCGSGSITRALAAIYKNGASYQYAGAYSIASSTEFGASISTIVYCNGSTDYIDFYARIDGGSVIIYSGQQNTWCNASLVRAA
jgi:hypothetical protein